MQLRQHLGAVRRVAGKGGRLAKAMRRAMISTFFTYMEYFTIPRPRPRLVNFKAARRSEFSTAAVASLKEDRNPEQVYLQEDGGGGLCRG